jgi:hypothetical protein
LRGQEPRAQKAFPQNGTNRTPLLRIQSILFCASELLGLLFGDRLLDQIGPQPAAWLGSIAGLSTPEAVGLN